MTSERDYPTDEELEKIQKWDTDFMALFDFIKSIWWMPDWGFTQKGRVFHISTAGWSGNEQIIRAMMDNRFFWMQCWELSRRGGHYEFQVPQ